MAEEKNRDLSPEELLKKLMENFGAEEEPTAGRQMTIEESASSNKRKVYRASRVTEKAEEELEEEPDDGISERLAQSIANAERYVSRMDAQGRVPDEEPAERESEPEPEEQPAIKPETEKQEPEEPEMEERDDANAAFAAAFAASAADDRKEPEEPIKPEETEQPEEPIEPEEPEEEKETNGAAGAAAAVAGAVFARDVFEELMNDQPEDSKPAEEPEKDEEQVEEEQVEEAAEEEQTEEEQTEESEAAEAESEASEEPQDAEEPAKDEESADAEEAEEVFEDEEAEEAAENEEAEEQENEEDDLLAFPLFGSALTESAQDERAADADGGNEAQEDGEEQPEESAEDADGEEPSDETIDEDEAHLMMIFGREKELGEKIGAEGVEKLRREMDLKDEPEKKKKKKQKKEEEYTSRAQNEEIFGKFRRAYTLHSLRLAAAAVFFLVIAVFEVGPYFAGGADKFFVGPFETLFSHPVYTALLGLQTTILLAALSYKEFIAGFRAVRSGRSSPELFLILTVVLTVIYECGLLYCHSVRAQLYNLPAALGVFLSIYFTRVHLKNDLLSFKIISSKKPKYAIRSLGDAEAMLEKEAFENCVSDLSNIYGVEKTDFVSNYTARINREPKFFGVSGILATVVLVIAVIFFLLGYYFSTGITVKQKILSALTSSILSAMFCMPLSAFVSFSFPLFKASKKAFSLDSAIVGAASTEEYANATVISFEDKDIFPAKNVRVRSLKLFGDSRIDHVLFGAASVFHKLGGPLDDVFAVATKESGITDDVDILHIGSGGVEAAVKGVHVNIGSFAYMRDKGLIAVSNDADDALELEGRVRIMYLALGRELAAKMYIEYKADKEFNELMSSLYKSGMCIGIRTLDPNIDDRMMRLHVDLGKFPVRILRMEKADGEKVKQTMSSGVVSKKSTKNLLKTLTFCRRVLQVIRAATILKVLSIVCGVAVSGLLLAMSVNGRLEGISEVNALWMTLYQGCWAALAALIALLFA